MVSGFHRMTSLMIFMKNIIISHYAQKDWMNGNPLPDGKEKMEICDE